MYLTSKTLRSFMVAATSHSFTEAAEQLNVTTSPLSKMISGLEDYLGTKLFFRIPEGIKLTKAGEDLFNALLPHYEALMSIESEWKGHGRILQKNSAQELVIGNCGGFLDQVEKLIAEVLKSKHFGSVRINTISGKNHLARREEVFSQLKKKNCHIVISYEPFDFDDDVATLPLDHTVLVAMIDTELHEKYPTDREKVLNIPLTQHEFEHDNPLHQTVRKAFLQFGAAKAPIILPERTQRLRAVEAGLAFSLVPEGLVHPDSHNITITSFLPDEPITVSRYMYYLRNEEEGIFNNILPIIKACF